MKEARIGDKVFDAFNNILMFFLCIMTIYPFFYVLTVSFNVGSDTLKGGLWLLPRMFTLENYSRVLSDSSIFTAYMVTIGRTVVGTTLSVFFTAAFAYGITRRDLVGRKLYIIIGTITMFFSGGLVPFYLLMQKMHLVDNFLVYIIPTMFSFWNVIIFQGFFREIPVTLPESAKMDGANEVYIFFKIIVPVATPAIACIALFNGVWHWNSWFDAYLFMDNPDMQTLQCLLMRLITQNDVNSVGMNFSEVLGGGGRTITMMSIRAATIIVAIGPVILIYPFLQKYFTKGLIIGSLKG